MRLQTAVVVPRPADLVLFEMLVGNEESSRRICEKFSIATQELRELARKHKEQAEKAQRLQMKL